MRIQISYSVNLWLSSSGWAFRNGFEAATISSVEKAWRTSSICSLELQPRNGKAKPYQVKQVRSVITSYGLVEAENHPESES